MEDEKYTICRFMVVSVNMLGPKVSQGKQNGSGARGTALFDDSGIARQK